jgi:PEP-CTERM motif
MRLAKLNNWVLAVAPLIALLVAPAAYAVTIFQDDFSGSGGLLDGTTPDVTTGSAKWKAGDTFLDNGTAGTTVASSANGQAAHLDFTPVAGQVYTAEATITNNQPNWIAFGFQPANPPGNDWTATDFSVRHSNVPGYAWMLTRNNSSGTDQEGFLGGGTSGGQSWNGDVVDPTNPVSIKIILDTTAANWTAQWFINNVSQGAPEAYAAAGNPGIGGIGFSHDRSATSNNGGLLRNFSLTAVPEPTAACLGLFGIVAAGLLRKRS